jgi:xylulokinase
MFLGLDVGTSGVKAILIERTGEVIANATSPLQLITPQPGWAEQDPESWWQATSAAVRDLLAQKPDADVAAIGISGQMHSSVFLDADGEVIRPALLWCDGRTTAECQEITTRAGGEHVLREWVCNPALEGFTLPKVLWLRNHEPAAFGRLSKVLLAKDFIRYRLTGAMATEPSDASGTLMFDPAHTRWSTELMNAVNLPISLLPDVGGSAERLGQVSARAAALIGLGAGVPVVGGGADNACGAAGVGAVTPGEAVSSWEHQELCSRRWQSPWRTGTTRPHVLPRAATGLVPDGSGVVGGWRLRLVPRSVCARAAARCYELEAQRRSGSGTCRC